MKAERSFEANITTFNEWLRSPLGGLASTWLRARRFLIAWFSTIANSALDARQKGNVSIACADTMCFVGPLIDDDAL